MPSPTPQPQPLPAPQLVETRFYLGSPAGISVIKLNHASGSAAFYASAAFAGQNVGWLNYDSVNQRILSVDAGAGRVQSNPYNATTGVLGNSESFLFKSGVIHTSLVPATNRYFLYTSSYGRGELDLYSMTATLKDPQTIGPSINYGTQAKTHSSAYDSKRKLLFVANLGLNRISIYRIDMNTGALAPVGQHSVNSPRTVLYHPGFDKLYLATESYSGPSEMIAYSIVDNQNAVSLQSEGSQAMPLSGADIKIDAVHRYAMATAREAGKESVWGMPLTIDGKKDMTRNSFSIPIDRPKPRSLEISADGQYILVAMDSDQLNNVQIYKLNYSPERVLTSAQKIFQHSLSGGGILCSLSIPYLK